MKKTLITILCGAGGFTLTMLILVGGRNLIRGTSIGDGLKDFWNWAISAMSGFSCGYAWRINNEKKKQDKNPDGKE